MLLEFGFLELSTGWENVTYEGGMKRRVRHGGRHPGEGRDRHPRLFLNVWSTATRDVVDGGLRRHDCSLSYWSNTELVY
jgi:hypothetical protein